MKCPKCNYVSHDYLEACRKCGVDLVAFKQAIGLVVLQPGVLDLSLVLGGVGADDLFESVEEEVIMHAGDDDDFDISLDDYVDQPAARRPLATSPRGGGRPAGNDLGGMDHLTLELDAADLPAELAAHLRASQVMHDTPGTPPALPSEISLEAEDTMPGHVTLDMGRDSISEELPPDVLREAARVVPPPRPPIPPVPQEIPLSMSQETLQISRALGLSLGGMAAAAAAASLAQNPPAELEAPEMSLPLELPSGSIDITSTQNPPAELEAPEMSLPLELPSGSIDITSAAPDIPAPVVPDAPAADTLLKPSGGLPSLSLHDVSLVEEPEVVDPTIPTIELLDVEAAMAQVDAELQEESPEGADAASAMLDSFELSVDDSVFAVGATVEVFGDPPDSVEPALDTETGLETDLTDLPPDVSFGRLLLPDADQPSLEALDTAALEASTLTFADDEAGAAPPSAARPTSEATFTPSDMFALGGLEEDDDEATGPEHLTLDLQAPELPSTFVSQMLADAEQGEPPAVPALPEDEPPKSARRFTVSDALALEALEPTEETVPGHLTLDLDISDLSEMASMNLAEVQFEEPPEAPYLTSAALPGEPPAPGDEELLLDLDDFEFIDEDEDEERH